MNTTSLGTRHGGIPEAVVDGETGILVEPGDGADEVAGQLGRLLDDEALRRRLGVRAHMRIEEQFSIERMINQSAQLLTAGGGAIHS